MILLPMTVLLIAGVVVYWLGGKAAAGTLPINYFAGIRTARTMKSKAAFEAGNRAAARAAQFVGVMMCVEAIIMGLAWSFRGSPDRPNVIWGTVVMMGIIVILVGVLVAIAKAQQAAHEVLEDEPPDDL
ncbi:MAG: SdpI family protein [Micrococcales bacterium]|nr:SdpI family protein [Micrococcales bacterium]